MTKQKFRKKPVVIEAYQTDKELDIETLEGTMHASIGDWIITGLRGEPYPCKPDIFEKSYEPVVEVKEAAATTIEQEPSCRETRQVDLISREQAIKEISDEFENEWEEADVNFNHGLNMALSIIKALSALEQEPIIHCKDCKYAKPFLSRYHCKQLDEDWEINFGAEHYCSFAERRESDTE